MTADQLTQLLNDLQDRLNGPAKYIFDLTMRQVVIEAIATLIGVILITLVVGIGWRIGLRAIRKEDTDDLDFLLMFGGIFTGIAAIVAGVLTFQAVTVLLNPEYAALARIINLVIPGSN